MSVQTTDAFICARGGQNFRVTFADLVAALPKPTTGRVSADGTGLSLQGATVTRTNTGRYAVTFDTPRPDDTFPVLLSQEQNAGRDDYCLAYRDQTVTGFVVEITEQDNSTSAGIYRDAGFSFLIPTIE